MTQHPPRCEYGVFEIESESENNKVCRGEREGEG